MSDSYFLAVKARTPSRLWVNNPTIAEIGLALEQGAVGCTTNPAYGGSLLKRAPDQLLPIVAECAAAATDDHHAADLVQQRLVARIAERFRPLYDATGGQGGFVSIQGAPDADHDGERILAEGRAARSIGPNIAVKIPATLPGLGAFESLVAEGAATIVTEVFSLAQLVYACDAYLRVTATTGNRPPFFMSPITGIFSDHLKIVAARDAIACSPDIVDQAGVALARACCALVEQRDYPVTLLFGGARLPIDFTGLIGGRTASTINYSTVEQVLALAPAVEDTIHQPIDARVLAVLRTKFSDFDRALAVDALTPAEFESFGPVLHFRDAFLVGWNAVLQAVAEARQSADSRGIEETLSASMTRP
jgi:transaldolase